MPRSSMWFALCFAVLLCTSLLLTGCPEKETPKGDITGWVSDAEGNLLPLVEVKLSDGSTTYTDSHGLFAFEGVSAEDEKTISFALDGYLPVSQPLCALENRTLSLEQRLMLRGEGQDLPSVGAGGRHSDGAGNGLHIPAGALGAGNGKRYGKASVHMTQLRMQGAATADLFPGAFMAQLNAGLGRRQLEAHALMHFEVAANGEVLSLNAGSRVGITMCLSEDAPYQAGDEAPLWYFNAASGVWVQGPNGLVIRDRDRLCVTAEVDCLGWWCCGEPLTAGHTFTGTVYDENNVPLVGAMVRAVGLDYYGVARARTDVEGHYQLFVKPNTQVRLELIPPGAFYVVTQVETVSGDAGAETVRDLTVSYDSCISGYVADGSGAPIADETVFSSGGGSAVTDENGYFCLAAPGGVYVAVYVPGRPARVVLTPDTATCGDTDLVPVNLTVYYPQDGDLVGYVFDNVSTFGNVPTHSATALFCSGFDGEQYEAYMREAPSEDTFTIYTKQYDLDLQANLALQAWFNASFTHQGDANGLLAEMNFAFNGIFDANITTTEDGSVPENTSDIELGRVGGLDAGEAGQVNNGVTQLPMPALERYMGGRNGQFGALGYYAQEPFWAENIFDYGELLTWSWPGGVDLGSFNMQTRLPDALVVTAPGSDAMKTLFEPVDGVIPDLELRWETTSEPGSYITLFLETVALNTLSEIGIPLRLHYNIGFGALVCRLVDDGTCTIPGDVLAQLVSQTLPEEKAFSLSTSTRLNFLLGLRTNVTENTQVPLLRGNGGNGRIAFISTSDPVAFWNVNFDAAIGWE